MSRPSRLVAVRSRRLWNDDRGSESVELAILLPVGLLVLAMLVIGARIALAGDRISGVAGIAARDASLARSASPPSNLPRPRPRPLWPAGTCTVLTSR